MVLALAMLPIAQEDPRPILKLKKKLFHFLSQYFQLLDFSSNRAANMLWPVTTRQTITTGINIEILTISSRQHSVRGQQSTTIRMPFRIDILWLWWSSRPVVAELCRMRGDALPLQYFNWNSKAKRPLPHGAACDWGWSVTGPGGKQ